MQKELRKVTKTGRSMPIPDSFLKGKEENKYFPGGAYQWSPSDEFNLSGGELEYMFKTVNDILSTPEAIKILKMVEVHKILEQKLKDGVENGIVKPKE